MSLAPKGCSFEPSVPCERRLRPCAGCTASQHAASVARPAGQHSKRKRRISEPHLVLDGPGMENEDQPLLHLWVEQRLAISGNCGEGRQGNAHILGHVLEPCNQLLIRPVDLEPFPGVFCQRPQNDERPKLAVNIAVLELLANSPGSFLSYQRRPHSHHIIGQG